MLPNTITLGASACLLGMEVRYNGGHKRSSLCSQSLSAHVDFIPVCPEVGIGMSVPREPIRLTGDPKSPRAVGTQNRSRDLTDALARYALHMTHDLQGISGFIFMQQSPSCGLQRVKVYHDNGHSSEPGQGIFAAAFCALNPDLPVEEDGRLNDPVLRENFLTRAYAFAEWQQLLKQGLTRSSLIAYHSSYKYLLMATDPAQHKILGRLLSKLDTCDLSELAPHYFSMLMASLKKCATRSTHCNTLQHLSGHLKNALSKNERQEMQNIIQQYRSGIIPLIVPITLLKHHFRNHPDPYIKTQKYMQPHPEELGLRNAI